MAAQLRIIRQRIRSVTSTAKITRAQELIATARVPRARDRLEAARPYTKAITEAVSALVTHHPGVDHALLNLRPDASRVAVLLIAGDRGFCGGYNQAVIRRGEALRRLLADEGKDPVFYLAGRKVEEWFRFRSRPYVRAWTGNSAQPAYADAAEIGRELTGLFDRPTREGGVGEVHVVYTSFVSMIAQRATAHRILPIEIEEREAPGGEGGAGPAPPPPQYDFEPSPQAVLDRLIVQYVRDRVWHMLLESSASEHAARRTAMMSATDNAHELIGRLTREANQARQAAITGELTEIVNGAGALG
ncbi:F0F1 ATP synthase subunit gamma [Bailinhaonella thermotolerans]|uniref:ATP synthase gamma chain n=1 Tax=Bailinhaonella thermotolerans TaxID=1070861 RepID=A0A3A4BJE0_9ACTN|nr:F0F1 ATP synthase subunit gamma [Bailinhaonella thermotolerans]RJL31362.1 F0F1 ATP synthase subunit gamma [Bailinhaonella thermotolerans]